MIKKEKQKIKKKDPKKNKKRKKKKHSKNIQIQKNIKQKAGSCFGKHGSVTPRVGLDCLGSKDSQSPGEPMMRHHFF